MVTADPEWVFLALTWALLLDAVLGDPPALWSRIPHPVVWVGRAIARVERIWDPLRHDPRENLRAGAAATLALVLAAALTGLLLQSLLPDGATGAFLAGLLAFPLFAWRGLVEAVREVARRLPADPAAARRALRALVGRDPDRLDDAGVARAAIESLAENFADAVVGPWFWLAVGGLPGLFAFKTVDTLDSMIGYRTPRHLHFGRLAARLDDALARIPARLAAVLIVLATLVVREARPGPAVGTIRRDARRHRSPNAGYPEAAVAGALGLRLAGPRAYHGVLEHEPWIGDGRAEATVADMERALRLVGAAWALLTLATALTALLLR